MNEEHKIIQQVYAAKEDIQAADQLIHTYLPFIRTETAKFLKRPPVEGQDDELSIAMIAFHEAIRRYSRIRGAFLKYAAMLIRSRLIDYSRKEQRHSGLVSLDTPMGEDDNPLGETIAEDRNPHEESETREATRAEIEELTRQMEEFGVSLSDVADNCPRQHRTLDACRTALQYARDNPALLEEFLRTKRLPAEQLTAGSGGETQNPGTAPQIYGSPAAHLYQRLRDPARALETDRERSGVRMSYLVIEAHPSYTVLLDEEGRFF